MDNDVNTGGFFSDRLEALIAAALQDGILTDKERELLKRRAEKEGEDWDEVEMIIEARLAEMQHANSPIIDKSINVISQHVKEETTRSDHQENLTTEENSMEKMIMDAKILLPIIKSMLPSMEVCDLSPKAKMNAYSYLEELAEKTSKIELSVAIFKECVRLFMDSKDDDEAKSKMRQLLHFESNYENSYEDLLNWKISKNEIEDLEKGTAPIKVLDIRDGILKGFVDNLTDVIKLEGKRFYLRDYDIKTITIPDSVREIQKEAFSRYKSLTEIRFSSDSCLERIEERAFMYCTNLNSIDFPKSLKSIGEEAFSGCKKLCDVAFPETLKNIGDNAFYGCGLKEIVIPDSVEEIGRNAFKENESLESAVIGKSAKNYFKEGLQEVVIPNSVTKIGYGAFAECKNLKSIELSDNITEIEEWAFSNTQLKEICFPKELRKIGKLSNGFEELRKLDFSKVTKLETIPGKFIGLHTPKLRELVIPMGVKIIEEDIGVINLKRLFLPPTIEKVIDVHYKKLDIYCYAPQIEELGMMIESIEYASNACTLYVLAEYVESYKAQRLAEEISEDLLIIDVIPEELRYFYDN